MGYIFSLENEILPERGSLEIVNFNPLPCEIYLGLL